jgi:hypothetical protein
MLHVLLVFFLLARQVVFRRSSQQLLSWLSVNDSTGTSDNDYNNDYNNYVCCSHGSVDVNYNHGCYNACASASASP